MIDRDDFREVVARCRDTVVELSDIPEWAESRGISDEIVKVAISLAVRAIAPTMDLGEELEDEDAPPSDKLAALIGAVAATFVLGVELGAILPPPEQEAGTPFDAEKWAKEGLPDPNNITSEDDDR